MTEPLDPLALAACVAAVMAVVAWSAVCWRRAGLVPTRWLSALAIALLIACVPEFVDQLLALRFPPENLQWRWGLAEAATWSVVTLPLAEAMRPVFAKVWELEARTGQPRRTAGFWPARAMSGPELAAWLAVLQAVGLESVEIFAEIEHVEEHPRHGPLVRRNSCPLGRLNVDDIDVVRSWDRFDRVVLDGTFRALQSGREVFPIRGDGSPLDRNWEADLADWPR